MFRAAKLHALQLEIRADQLIQVDAGDDDVAAKRREISIVRPRASATSSKISREKKVIWPL